MTRGFTLIELLVLIAIIGILTAAVIANMNRAKVQAFNAAALGCAQDIRNQQKIAQTTEKRFVTYDNLPAKTACRPLEAVGAAPTGGATELQYAYQARHPRGNKTYVVTDADIYTDGIGAQGEVLSADPAAALLTGAPAGPDPDPIGSGPGPATTLAECQTLSGQENWTYHHIEGDLNGTVIRRVIDSGATAYTTTYTRLGPDVTLREQEGFTNLIVSVTLPNGGMGVPWYGPATVHGDGRITVGGATRTPAEWVAFTRADQGATNEPGNVGGELTGGYFPDDTALPACARHMNS